MKPPVNPIDVWHRRAHSFIFILVFWHHKFGVALTLWKWVVTIFKAVERYLVCAGLLK